MRILLLTVPLALVACTEDDGWKVAEEVCPFIVRTSVKDDVDNMQRMVDAGMEPRTASQRLSHYRSVQHPFMPNLDRCEVYISGDESAIRKSEAMDAEYAAKVEEMRHENCPMDSGDPFADELECARILRSIEESETK